MSTSGNSIIGAPIQRIEGSLKVTGAARYAVDHPMDNIAYGVPVASTVGNARIANIDTSNAERMPGVLTIHSPRQRRPALPPRRPARTEQPRW
jgi:CO/xanthine dehydrogenase Mo-binding subunit